MPNFETQASNNARFAIRGATNAPVLFLKHFQVAYVVRDIKAAQQRFARDFGVNYWDVLDMKELLGPDEGARFISNAYVGELMIELIEPDPAYDSIYSGWIPDEEDGACFHHLGFLADSAKDFEDGVTQLDAAGYVGVYNGSHADTLDYHYADTTALLGHYYELIHLKPEGEEFFARIPRN